MLMLVEPEPLIVDAAVEMDGEVCNAAYCITPYEALLESLSAADEDSPGDREVSVGPGRDEESPVGFNIEEELTMSCLG